MRCLAGSERCPEPVGVIAPVAQHGLGSGQGFDHQGDTLVVTHLAFGEQYDQRATLVVPHGEKLGVQPALGAPDT